MEQTLQSQASHRLQKNYTEQPHIIIASSPVKFKKKGAKEPASSFSEAIRLNKLNLLGDKLYNLTNDNKKIKTKKKKASEQENVSKVNLYPKRNLFEKNSMRLMKKALRSQSARKSKLQRVQSYSTASVKSHDEENVKHNNYEMDSYFQQKINIQESTNAYQLGQEIPANFLQKRIQKQTRGLTFEVKERNVFNQPSSSLEKKLLPFTGVDQAFLINRPLFTREMSFISEKLNDMVHLYNPSDYGFDSAKKSRLVYDSQYSVNQPQTDKDTRLYVPPPVRKANGAHINDKVSKYYYKLAQFYTRINPEDTTLIFESRFESGNLARATQIGEFAYNLELRSDFGSLSPQMTQWYFFEVKNTRKNQEYTFNITNLIKPDSSYNQGMMPCVYSEKRVQTSGNGWYRGGTHIRYFQTPIKSKKKPEDQPVNYTLSFRINFEYDDDCVYFSHCYPYTYSDLLDFLNKNCNPKHTKDRLKRTQICRSIAGNPLEMLIITNLASSQDDIAERPAVILSSRVHPGESNASFIIEGTIKFLISNELEAKILREKYVFKIIPMLNPDGVICGNYRSSLGGHDLNRQWLGPSMKVSPEIYSMKDMIRKTLECRKIAMFVDIHGHSRQKNLFMYGCSKNQQGPHLNAIQKNNPLEFKNKVLNNGQSNILSNLTVKEKVFPWIFHKNCEDFDFASSSFGIVKSKESTGRVVVFREFNIQNSYTLECSFCGPTQGSNKDCHFSIQNLLDMGKKFALSILEFSSTKIQKSIFVQIEQFYKNGCVNFPGFQPNFDINRLMQIDKEISLNPVQIKKALVLDPIQKQQQSILSMSQFEFNPKERSISRLLEQRNNENNILAMGTKLKANTLDSAVFKKKNNPEYLQNAPTVIKKLKRKEKVKKKQ